MKKHILIILKQKETSPETTILDIFEYISVVAM